MTNSLKYSFALQRGLDPDFEGPLSGDERLVFDLQNLISQRLGIEPIPCRNEYDAFGDPSRLVISVNHDPTYRQYDWQKRWFGISVRNDMGLGDMMISRADVALEPTFTSMPGHVKVFLTPKTTIFSLNALPSRCTPLAVSQAAEKYLQSNKEVKAANKPITTIVVGNLRPEETLIIGDRPVSGTDFIADAYAIRIKDFMQKRGGSVLLSTSRRTSQRDEEMLLETLRPWLLKSWTSFNHSEANPYLAFMGAADEILVSSDSISMISDAVATQKPFRIMNSGQEHNYGQANILFENKSASMARRMAGELILRGAKSLDSDLQISSPPPDLSGVIEAVDGICRLIVKKYEGLKLGD